MLSTHDVVSELVPNPEFSRLASDEQIERAVQALEANGIHALVAENGEEATRIFFELVPEGAEVFLGASVTLEKLGIRDEIDKYLAHTPTISPGYGKIVFNLCNQIK